MGLSLATGKDDTSPKRERGNRHKPEALAREVFAKRHPLLRLRFRLVSDRTALRISPGGSIMQESSEELLRFLVEQERQLIKDLPPLPPREPSIIHYTELAEAPLDSPIATEWNCYLQQVGRLLAEGQEGKWVLIKGEQIVGIWDSFDEADEMQKALLKPVVIKQILSHELLLRIGYNPYAASNLPHHTR